MLIVKPDQENELHLLALLGHPLELEMLTDQHYKLILYHYFYILEDPCTEGIPAYLTFLNLT